jgi:hypothetical protein
MGRHLFAVCLYDQLPRRKQMVTVVHKQLVKDCSAMEWVALDVISDEEET